MELLASGASYLKEMFLQCPLHLKMNMRLRSSSPLKGEYPQYLQLWVARGCHFRAKFLILCTVLVAESLGMQKVLPIHFNSYFSSTQGSVWEFTLLLIHVK